MITIEHGDYERFRIPKETIYKIEKDSVYTTLTESEILETRKNDPFWTSMGSYTGHTGHEELEFARKTKMELTGGIITICVKTQRHSKSMS